MPQKFLGFPPGSSPGVPYAGLASGANTFMAGQAALPYRANLPGYDSMVGQRSANIGGLLRGQVPEDVQYMLAQQGAERGVATGSPGSPNANAAWLRALGLTSLGLQQQGSQQLGAAIEQTPVPELFNPMSLYVPERMAGMELAAAKESTRKPSGTPYNWGSPSSATWRGRSFLGW